MNNNDDLNNEEYHEKVLREASVYADSIFVLDSPAAKYIDNLPQDGMTVPQKKEMIDVVILYQFQVDARTNKAKEKNEEEKYRKYYVIQPVSHHDHNYPKYRISTQRKIIYTPILESGTVDFDENSSWETKEKFKPDNPPKETDYIKWVMVPVLQCVNIIAFIRFYTKARYKNGNNNFRKENKFFGTWVAAREHPVLQKHLDIKANTEVIKKGGLDVNTEPGEDNMKKLKGCYIYSWTV
jgi:hypothetical protein